MPHPHDQYSTLLYRMCSSYSRRLTRVSRPSRNLRPFPLRELRSLYVLPVSGALRSALISEQDDLGDRLVAAGVSLISFYGTTGALSLSPPPPEFSKRISSLMHCVSRNRRPPLLSSRLQGRSRLELAACRRAHYRLHRNGASGIRYL